LLLLLASSRAYADTIAPSPAAAATAPLPWVEIRVLGDETALARVRDTAAELFSRLEVRLRVLADADAAASPGAEPPLVLAYVDLRVPTSPLVDVDDGRTHQELMRRNLSDISTLETAVEAAVHVVYASVESLLLLAGPQRAELPRPPRSRRAPSPPASSGLDLGALFRLVSLGGSRVAPGGGAALELRTDAGNVQAELGLFGALHAASQLDFDDGRLSLHPYALRLVPGLSARLSRQLQGSVGVGVGLDHFVLDVHAPASGGKALDRAIYDPILATQLGLRFPLAGAWFASVLGTLDVDLAPTRFISENGDSRHVLFTLPRLRAGLVVIASLSPTSVRRFPNRTEQP
jgi:hypothetical protein